MSNDENREKNEEKAAGCRYSRSLIWAALW